MAEEVARLRKKRGREERRREEREHLTPTRQLQPRDRTLRFTNVRSAQAEAGLIRVVLADGEFFRQLDDLTEAHFSSPVLWKAYSLLRRRWEEGKSLSLGALDGALTGEEAELVSAAAREEQPLHTAQQALNDSKQIILEEYRKKTMSSPEDLRHFSEQMRQTKGYGG